MFLFDWYKIIKLNTILLIILLDPITTLIYFKYLFYKKVSKNEAKTHNKFNILTFSICEHWTAILFLYK